MAKAPAENGSDGEERKPGEQNGLDSGSFVENIDFVFLLIKNLLSEVKVIKRNPS